MLHSQNISILYKKALPPHALKVSHTMVRRAWLALALLFLHIQAVNGLWYESCSASSFKQVSSTSVPQGLNLTSNAVEISPNDYMYLTFDSPLVYYSDPSKMTRSVQLALVPTERQTWPSDFASMSSSCTRTFAAVTGGKDLNQYPSLASLSVDDYLTNPVAYHGTTPCKLQYAYYVPWDNVVADCNLGAMDTVTESDVNWWRTRFNIMALWQDRDAAGNVVFESNTWWAVTIKYQLDKEQSTGAVSNVFAPYVSNSFTLSAALLTKYANSTLKIQYDYSFKTRYPYKPIAYNPTRHGLAAGYNDQRDTVTFPTGDTWAPIREYVYGSADRVMDSMLAAQSCETGGVSPQAGDECIQTGSLIFTMPTTTGFTPAGVYNLNFDNDCSSWFQGAQSDCTGWPIFGQGFGESGGTVLSIPVIGTSLAALPITSGIEAEAIADPDPTSALIGARGRMDFLATYEIPVSVTKVRLDEMTVEQLHTNGTVLYTWSLVSKGVLFPMAQDALLNLTYDGWPNRVDCRVSLFLTYGDNKTVAFLTPDDLVGVRQTFRATMTMSLEYNPITAPSIERRFTSESIGIYKREVFPGWAASTTVTHISNVEAINLGNATAADFASVVPYVANSFAIPSIAYEKNSTTGNTTFYVEYELTTRFPYMITESSDPARAPVLLLPSTGSWPTARTNGWLRSDWAVSEHTWSDPDAITTSTCRNRGWFNFIVPTQYLCDPAGTFEMVWDLECFQTDPNLCTDSGSIGAAGAFQFVVTTGINLCAASDKAYGIASSFALQGASQVPVGNQVHLKATHAADKMFYSTKLMTVDVQETDSNGEALVGQVSWRLWQNAAVTAMGTRVDMTVSESWQNSTQTTSIKDIYFTPNIGSDKTSYMIKLSDRSQSTLYFTTTINTRFFFDSISFASNYPRRLMYRDKSVQVTSMQNTVDKCAFVVNVAAMETTEATLSPATQSVPVGVVVGLAVGSVVLVVGIVAVAVVVRRRREPLKDVEGKI